MGYVTAQLVESGIDDWVTVAAYLLAAVLCWVAARAVRGLGAPVERLFWLAAAILLGFFAVNEILDLQTLLTAAGRTMAREEGWYRERRAFQWWFMIGLGSMVTIGLIAVGWLLRSLRAWVHLALTGFVLIAVFDILRAASMHHVDQIFRRGSTGFGFGSVMELGGIAIVAFAAWYAARTAPAGRSG